MMMLLRPYVIVPALLFWLAAPTAESAAVKDLRFGYGRLDPEFDPKVTQYILYVPRCDVGEGLMPLDVTVNADTIDSEIEVTMKSFKGKGIGQAFTTVDAKSGIMDPNFNQGELLKI